MIYPKKKMCAKFSALLITFDISEIKFGVKKFFLCLKINSQLQTIWELFTLFHVMTNPNRSEYQKTFKTRRNELEGDVGNKNNKTALSNHVLLNNYNMNFKAINILDKE